MLPVKAVIFLVIFSQFSAGDYSFIDLPENHLAYYFNTFPNVAQQCLADPKCEYQSFLLSDSKTEACWGYEADCRKGQSYQTLKCPGK